MNRVYHTWDKWECYPAGFYENNPPEGMAPTEAVMAYANFLRDSQRFRRALSRVLLEWPHSCEHYLSNENMNRIAWLGQAAACIDMGLSAKFRGGFNTLTKAEQDEANATALVALNRWLVEHGETPLTMEQAQSKTVPNLY